MNEAIVLTSIVLAVITIICGIISCIMKCLTSTDNYATNNGTHNPTRRNSGGFGGTNVYVIDTTGGYWNAGDSGGGSIQRETWIQEPAPPYVPCCSSHLCDQVLQIEQIPEGPPPAYDSCQPNVSGFLFYTVQDPIERLNS